MSAMLSSDSVDTTQSGEYSDFLVILSVAESSDRACSLWFSGEDDSNRLGWINRELLMKLFIGAYFPITDHLQQF